MCETRGHVYFVQNIVRIDQTIVRTLLCVGPGHGSSWKGLSNTFCLRVCPQTMIYMQRCWANWTVEVTTLMTSRVRVEPADKENVIEPGTSTINTREQPRRNNHINYAGTAALEHSRGNSVRWNTHAGTACAGTLTREQRQSVYIYRWNSDRVTSR